MKFKESPVTKEILNELIDLVSRKENDDAICAICKHNRLILTSTYCGNKKQKSQKLRSCTRYNDHCDLFELRDESFYGSGKAIEIKK